MNAPSLPWAVDDPRPIHFMGVGGAGMCALAEAFLRGGSRVTGCDLQPGDSIRTLERMGARVHRGHDPGHLEGVGGLVVSSAVPSDHPEIQAARAAGIPVLKRAEALGAWVNRGQVVAVAGTHGKTTTTAMVTHVLEAAGLEPTGFVGGEVAGWGGHLHPGGGELFVVEADEYDRSFLQLRPRFALITNVEADHLDIYGSADGVREGFREFLRGVAPGGTVVACADDPGAGSMLQGTGLTPVSYGFQAGSVIRGEALESRADGSRFRVWEVGVDRGHLQVGIPGIHNARNALGAAALARSMEVDWDAIRTGLAAFSGVRRRFQTLGEPRGIRIVDDYAHHPTELRAALEAARSSFPTRRLVAVFQPHLYSRTRDFAREFGEALALADRVWVTEIYPAREKPIDGVDGALVARSAEEAGAPSVQLHTALESLHRALSRELAPGDVCLFMGAGSISEVGPRLVEILNTGGPHA